MNWVAEAITFLVTRQPMEILALFWYFILFDFSRYVLLDNIVLTFYMLSARHRQAEKQLARRALFREKPLVSVLVPGKNEGRHLPQLAASLQAQTYRHLEVIVVDDGSDDDTADICRRLLRKGAIHRFFCNPVRGGKASAANLALRYAGGRFVIHLDADSHLREDSVETILLPFYQDERIGAVGGDIRVKNVFDSVTTALQAIDYMKSISTGRVVSSTLGILRTISGAYGAFRKDLLDRLKGWDVGPGLDGDITLKIRKSGYKVVFEPEAVCYTNVPDSPRKLARQRYRWDRSLVRFRIRKHSDLLSLRNRNFSIRNFLTAADNLFFNFLLNFKWWFYFIQIVVFQTAYLKFVLPINYLIYFLSNVFEYFMVLWLFGRTIRREEILLILFLPLMPLYTGFFLRGVRTYAHLMELIWKTSFEDPWNPIRVSRIARQREGH
ncbi:MAG: glycosyltransferase [Desulfosarcinaceae bacterium]|jgi:cellulose synthase/poly-beta-1,6-N-acetylglucosamine synthase-like glycosyltransferase